MLRRLPSIVTMILLLFTTKVCFGNTTDRITECFIKAGKYYDIPPIVLWGIAYVESSFNPLAVNYNKSSRDLGIMQINTRWLPVLNQYGIYEKHLYDPCINIFVGAWILKRCQISYKDWEDVLSCYHTGKGASKNQRGKVYAKKVFKVIKKATYAYKADKTKRNS